MVKVHSVFVYLVVLYCVHQVGIAPEGSRGARVVWTLGMKYLVVSGFDK